jgi:hypothetical protein
MGQEGCKVKSMATGAYGKHKSYTRSEEAGALLYPCNGVDCHVMLYHVKAEVIFKCKRCAAGCRVAAAAICVPNMLCKHYINPAVGQC